MRKVKRASEKGKRIVLHDMEWIKRRGSENIRLESERAIMTRWIPVRGISCPCSFLFASSQCIQKAEERGAEREGGGRGC